MAPQLFADSDIRAIYINKPEDSLTGAPWDAPFMPQIKWVGSFYTVAYLTQDASGVVADATPYALNDTATVLSGNTLSKPGYRFAGWERGSDGSTLNPGDNLVILGNETLTAKWERDESIVLMNIPYDANDGSGRTDSSGRSYLVGAGAIAERNMFARQGLMFVSWNTNADGSGDTYLPGDWLTVTPGVTLYAQWKEKLPSNMSVFYHANLGVGLLNDKNSYNPGDTATVLKPGLIQWSGHTFTGWNTAADGSGVSYVPGDTLTIGRADVFLYAQWKKVESDSAYLLTYMDGPTIGLQETYADGTKVAVLGNMFDGGTFYGWNTSPNGSGATYEPGDELTVYRDTILYAQRTPRNVFAPNITATPSPRITRLDNSYTATYDGFSFYQPDKVSWHANMFSTENAYYSGFLQRNSTIESIRVGGALLQDSAGKDINTLVGVFIVEPDVNPQMPDITLSNCRELKTATYTPGGSRAPIIVTREEMEAVLPGVTDETFPSYIVVKYAEADVPGALQMTDANFRGVNADPVVVTYKFREVGPGGTPERPETPTYKETDTYARPNVHTSSGNVVDTNNTMGIKQSFTYFDSAKTKVEHVGDVPEAFLPGQELQLRVTVTNESEFYRNSGVRSFINSNVLEYVSGSASMDGASSLAVAELSVTGMDAAGYLPVGTTVFGLLATSDSREINLMPGQSESFLITVKVRDNYEPGRGIFVQSATMLRSEISTAHFDEKLVLENESIYGEATITFKVANGTWEDRSTADKIVTLTLRDGKGTLAPGDVPTGMKANAGYEGGAWDKTPNVDPDGITSNMTYIYTFTKQNTGGGGGGGGGSTTYYTLKYVSNGGSKIDDERHEANTTVQLTKTPTWSRHEFLGWYSDAALTDKATTVKMTNNKTVYAKWRPKDDTIPGILNGEDHFAYIHGYDDGLVRPAANITRAEVAAIFFSLLKEEIRSENLTEINGFTDVNAGDWHNTAISTIAKLGIVKGRGEGIFDPNALITRAEFAVIAARFDTAPYTGEDKFPDIADNWARAEINRAAARGWVKGDASGKFRPEDSITWAETMAVINGVLGRQVQVADDLLPGMRTWPDNLDTTAWYYLAVQEATNSHDYDRKSDNIHERWTKLTETPTRIN